MMTNVVTAFNNNIPISKIDSVDEVHLYNYKYYFLIYTKDYPLFCDVIVKDTREDAVAMRDTIIEAMMEVE